MSKALRVTNAIRVSVLLLLAPLHGASSQDLASLRAGEPIRLSINSPGSRPVVGRLISVSADTIFVGYPANSLAIGLADLGLLQVKRRSGGSVAKSAAFGLIGGAIGTALIGAATGTTDTGDGRITGGDKALIGAVLGGAAGLIGGTIFGACCSSVWQTVPLPGKHQ